MSFSLAYVCFGWQITVVAFGLAVVLSLHYVTRSAKVHIFRQLLCRRCVGNRRRAIV